MPGPAKKKTKMKRKCLKCGKSFKSTGPGNRICGKCRRMNSKIYTTRVHKVVSDEHQP